MDPYDVVIVGGSAAGLTAATTARKHYPKKSICLLRREEQVPIPCGIPYVFGTVGAPEKNLMPAQQVLAQNGIDGFIDEVLEVNREARQLVTAGKRQLQYEKLVWAVGSDPVVPPFQGLELDGIYAIQKNVPHLERILEALSSAKSLGVVGCGFIGVEIAEECRRKRPELRISIVEMQHHCLQLVYDEEICRDAEQKLLDQGIELLRDERVKAFEGEGRVSKIKLEGGEEVDVDMVLLGIGAKANTDLAQKAGLEIGPTGGIQVNRYMQTSDPNIFACGDCAEKVSFFDGQPCSLKLASLATMEARIAGANLFGTQRVNLGAIGVYSTVLGDSAFAVAGLTVSEAEKKGYNVVVGEAEAMNRHPGCMPGGANLKVKLVFEQGSRVILGGQVAGAKSGGEVINTISACIHQRMTADDIATFQTGTHPALTASPVSYQLVNAAETAIGKMMQC